MARKLGWLVLVLAVIVSGCQEEPDETEQVSLEESTKVMASQLESLQQQTLELMVQHAWLRASLNKCIEKLEIEKGLEPMPFDMYQHLHFPKLKRDPNAAKRYAEKQQKFFVPYQGPNQPSLSAFEHQDIRILIALLRLQCNSIEMYMSGSKNWIANFERRLKRLEENLIKEPELQNEPNKPK